MAFEVIKELQTIIALTEFFACRRTKGTYDFRILGVTLRTPDFFFFLF
jgi:hypothetical protein